MNTFRTTIAFGLILAAAGWLAAGECCPRGCPSCGCKVCEPTPETSKVKKHCWDVQCKDICIPKFKWPWEPCCNEPRCGRVKTVKVLVKKEYECEKCGYKWSVKSVDECGPIDAKTPYKSADAREYSQEAATASRLAPPVHVAEPAVR